MKTFYESKIAQKSQIKWSESCVAELNMQILYELFYFLFIVHYDSKVFEQ